MPTTLAIVSLGGRVKPDHDDIFWTGTPISSAANSSSNHRSNERYRLHDFVHAHLPELTDLWIAAWTKAMPAIDFETRRAWFVDHVAKLKEQGVAITCAFDAATGAMAGFVTLDAKTGHIDQLAAAPMYWSKGAAMALLDDAKRRAKILRLDVNQDNPRAVRFYEKHDFRRRAAGANPASGLKTWSYEWRRSD